MKKDPILEAKKFGRTMFWAFLALGLLLFWRHKPAAPYFTGLALFFLLASFVPKILIPIQKGWMKIGHALGWVNTRILLSILFFLILTPIRLILSLLGKDLLDQKIDRNKTTYWNLREVKAIDPKRYERLY